MIRNCFCLLLTLCFTFGCNVKQSSSSSSDDTTEEITLKYSLGYKIEKHNEYTQVDVKDPWNEGRLLQRYILVPRDKDLPANLPKGTVVRVPLKNIVVYTSVHCAAIDELGAVEDIAGVCESRYIKVPTVEERLKSGIVKDLGESTSPNVEKMIEIETEAVIASPFDHGGYGPVEKIGIPIIECADYMENLPLGRAEWLKFLGLLTGREAAADSLFAITESNYNRIKMLVADVAKRPTVFSGMKYGSAWHISAGDSYMAKMYADAGADYIFGYLPGAGSTPLTFETVLDKAVNADFWLVQYNRDSNMTYGQLQSEYTPYKQFGAFKNRSVIGCNTKFSRYYEEVPYHPDYLLSEFISIFHPELLPEHKLRYYRALE